MVTRRTARLDVVLLGVAVLFGLGHLAYPYGREHALMAYAGREWLLRGAAPYQSTFVQDGPGLVLVAGIATIVSGGSAIVLRALSLAAAVATGWLAPSLATDARTRARAPLRGIAALAASLFAHGGFDFWDSGRGGTFVAFFAMTSYVLALRPRPRASTAFACGLAASAALLVWPASWWFVWPAPMVGAYRTGRASGGVAALLGSMLPVGLVALALGPHASADAYELLWQARCLYLGPRRDDAMAFVTVLEDVVAVYAPVAPTLVAAFVSGCFLDLSATQRRRRFARRLAVAMLAVATVAAVHSLRRYFFEYEVLVLVVPLVVTMVVADAVTWFGERRAVRTSLAATLVGVSLFAVGAYLSDWSATGIVQRRGALLAHVFGAIDGVTYRATFARDDIGFRPAELAEISSRLRTLVAPGDDVSVRGFEPDIYLRAGVHFSGRFSTTPAIQWDSCAYRRAEWIREDREGLLHPPRWVVALDALPGLDDPSSYLAAGYVERTRTEHFVVLEKKP